jgi:hypothetical protein
MKTSLTIALFFTAMSVDANEWQPPDKLMKAVFAVESSNGQFTYGDHGRSLGDYQLSEAAWLDVSEWRKTRGLKTYAYHGNVYNSYINRVYARNYFSLIYSQLEKKYHREPTHGELYAAYNIGLSSFAQCRYNVNRVNRTTQEKCRQITVLMAAE